MTTDPNMTADVNTILHAAHELAALGYAVFPCSPRDCRPLTEHGFHDAVKDTSQISAWWRDKPGSMIGLPAGPNGLVVLDIDPRNGGDVTIESFPELPDTVNAFTARHGRHYYFAHPGDDIAIPSRANVLGPGLDIRADGGYVIAPPSVKTGGGQYVWELSGELGDCPLAPVPDWMIGRIIDRAPERRTSKMAASNDLQRAKLALDQLSHERCENYDDWVAVGMALHAIGDDGFDLWDTWSQRSQKYDARETEKKWRSFRREREHAVTFATLIHMVKNDGGRVPPPQKPPPGEAPRANGSGNNGSDIARPIVVNAVAAQVPTGEGDKTRTVFIGRPITEISDDLFGIMDGWPARVDDILFHDVGGHIRFLGDVNKIFAWLAESAAIDWRQTSTAPTKSEFYAHLQHRATKYVTVEELPHEPAIDGAYYAWRAPADYDPPNLETPHLDALCGYFANTETPEDAALIRAMFCTPGWGGMPACRPIYIVVAPDRNCGKSTLTEAVATLWGGAIEISPDTRDESRIVERILDLAAMTRRCVRVDNIKSQMSSSLIENLVTTSEITGHRLYHGEARRVNYLTWLATANSPVLSRDIADRAFFICLQKPEPQPGWREGVVTCIAENRDRIIADCLSLLRKSHAAKPCTDRWQSYIDGVLRRVTTLAPQITKQNQRRRDSHDSELEEAETIWGEILCDHAVSDSQNEWVSVPATQMTSIVNRALGANLTAKSVSQRMQAHIASGRLSSLERNRTSVGYMYTVKKPRDTSDTPADSEDLAF